MAGIYIHIPFCSKMCNYCDFHSSKLIKELDKMIDAICLEIEQRSNYLCNEEITTLYIGGGTPSLLSDYQLERIIRAAETHYKFTTSQLAEFTIECNPEDLSEEYLLNLKGLGCNRLSIGIQSLNDNILHFLNRRHSATKAVEAVKSAQKVGFANISVDIIFGIPGLDNQTLKKTLKDIIGLKVQHISAYHLTIEENSVFGKMQQKGKLTPINDSESVNQYNITEKEFIDNKYIHYEVSNYALEGYYSKHNSNYWSGVKYVGIGPSAHSFDGVSREWNINNNIRYIEGIFSGKRDFEIETLTHTERYNEYVMTRLRCAEGVVERDILEMWGEEIYSHFSKARERLISQNKIRSNNGILSIATKDFMLSDMIISEFIYVAE